MAATRIVTHVDVYDGDGKYLGTTDSVKELTGWQKGKPVRKNVSLKTEGKPGMTIEMSLGIEDTPEGALDDLPNWAFKGNAELNAIQALVFTAEGKPGKGQVKATVYIDPETKRPLKIEYLMPYSMTFGHGEIHASVEYGATAAGQWLPSTVYMDQSGSYMFWKRRIVIKQQLQDWTKRP